VIFAETWWESVKEGDPLWAVEATKIMQWPNDDDDRAAQKLYVELQDEILIRVFEDADVLSALATAFERIAADVIERQRTQQRS